MAPDEPYYLAWERFQNLLSRCSQHGLSEWALVEKFYNGLTYETRARFDTSAGGHLMGKRDVAECNDLFESFAQAEYEQRSSNRNSTPITSSSSSMRGVHHVNMDTSVAAALESLARDVRDLKMRVDRCEICRAGDATSECLVSQEQANYVGGQGRFGHSYNPGWGNSQNPQPFRSSGNPLVFILDILRTRGIVVVKLLVVVVLVALLVKFSESRVGLVSQEQANYVGGQGRFGHSYNPGWGNSQNPQPFRSSGNPLVFILDILRTRGIVVVKLLVVALLVALLVGLGTRTTPDGEILKIPNLLDLQELLTQLVAKDATTQKILHEHDVLYKNQQSAFLDLQRTVGDIAKRLDERPQGHFPGQPQTNPNAHVKAVTTRSGRGGGEVFIPPVLVEVEESERLVPPVDLDEEEPVDEEIEMETPGRVPPRLVPASTAPNSESPVQKPAVAHDGVDHEILWPNTILHWNGPRPVVAQTPPIQPTLFRPNILLTRNPCGFLAQLYSPFYCIGPLVGPEAWFGPMSLDQPDSIIQPTIVVHGLLFRPNTFMRPPSSAHVKNSVQLVKDVNQSISLITLMGTCAWK
ncbi:hypothetical protein E3N88_34349 [Mikania micrantha]|uniref:Retrotransposon gag domain-containing protein n=1 Tax=Mikania micrantha TaxID=192012 RepID=A0A5N6LXV5_9ASTR|nr:hypothetical protein E3N88_34349 [Mikania micrantha]